MHRKVLKKILAISAIAAASFVFGHGASVQAATAPFTLHTQDQDYPIDQSLLSDWAKPSSTGESYIAMEPERNLNNFVLNELGLKNNQTTKLNFEKYNISSIYKYIKSLEADINTDPEDAKMTMKDNHVTDFNPGQVGQTLDVKTSIDSIIAALDQGKASADLSILQTSPLKDLSETNDMGIKELVSVGESDFSTSPNNRIFNIKVGMSKETGVIVKPGEEFSFNKYLGPVDGEHGFLPELVIKKTGTVPEFGGGLCQVSSTVFRAAMNAGLPITARRNHSYAVSYYAPQGTDATIYPGVQDLKFINDTSASLLIWPELSNNKLRFYLYGTKDGRQVTFDGPHSFDRKPDGSLKAIWTRFVTRADGKQRKDVFNSTYQSPALFHKVVTFPENVSTNPTLNQ